MTPHDLTLQIEAFAAEFGIAPATVTSRAVGNSRLYKTLKSGGDCTMGIASRVLSYMANRRAEARAAPRAGKGSAA